MKEFLAAAVIFLLAVLGMAVGVILRRRPLRGSCGGLANLRDEEGRILCEVCSHPSPECRGSPASPPLSDTADDASCSHSLETGSPTEAAVLPEARDRLCRDVAAEKSPVPRDEVQDESPASFGKNTSVTEPASGNNPL